MVIDNNVQMLTFQLMVKYVYIWDAYFVITVPADAPALHLFHSTCISLVCKL